MSGERPWWLRPVLPVLTAAGAVSTLSFALTYSSLDAWSWADYGVQTALLIAVPWYLARIEDAHCDAIRPRSLNRWGVAADTPEPSLIALSRPLAGFLLAAVVFAVLGWLAGTIHRGLWIVAMLGYLLVLKLLNVKGWKPTERIAGEWWPAVRYRWPVTTKLLGLFLFAQLLAGTLVALAFDGPSFQQPVAVAVGVVGGWWLLRSLRTNGRLNIAAGG